MRGRCSCSACMTVESNRHSGDPPMVRRRRSRPGSGRRRRTHRVTLPLREVYRLRGTVPSALERITGSLLGAACGDALGAPFEGRALVDREELLGWSVQDAVLSYTDDTAMMRTLA